MLPFLYLLGPARLLLIRLDAGQLILLAKSLLFLLQSGGLSLHFKVAGLRIGDAHDVERLYFFLHAFYPLFCRNNLLALLPRELLQGLAREVDIYFVQHYRLAGFVKLVRARLLQLFNPHQFTI